MELDNLTYNKIIKLSEQGDALAGSGKFDKAISKYEKALKLLPPPCYIWEAATWLYTAIGDAYFFNRKFDIGLNFFLEAQKCPNALDNPFIYVRIGECFYEVGDFIKAQEYLLRAYMLDGEDVFSDADPKYLKYINEYIEKDSKNDNELRISEAEVSIRENTQTSGVKAMIQEEDYISKIDILIKESDLYFAKKEFVEAIRLLEDAWNELPHDKYETNESFLIVKYILNIAIKAQSTEKIKQWISHILKASPNRADIGEREMWMGKALYALGNIEESKEYFQIAYNKSNGRQFDLKDSEYLKLISKK